MPKRHETDGIPEKKGHRRTRSCELKIQKSHFTSPKCPNARTWLIVSMISDKIKLGDDKSIIGKPRNKPKNTKIIIIVFSERHES